MVVTHAAATHETYALAIKAAVPLFIGLIAFIGAGVCIWHDHRKRKQVIYHFSDKPFDYMHAYDNETVFIYDYPFERISSNELRHDTILYRVFKRYEQRILNASGLTLGYYKQIRAIRYQMNKEIIYFDRVCQLDVPDLVKAKVWACL